MGDSSSGRTLQAEVVYFKRDCPADGGIAVSQSGAGVSAAEYTERMLRATEPQLVPLIDARTGPGGSGGLESWKLDTHGFAVVTPPPAVDFFDQSVTKEQYYPKLAQMAKELTGAKDAFVWAMATRGDDGRSTNPKERDDDRYSRYAHSDSGPEGPPMLRRVLVGRFGVPQEEAQNCDLMFLNVWHPRDHPAYRNPLCLLDCSTVDREAEVVPLKMIRKKKDGQEKSAKPNWEECGSWMAADPKFQTGWWGRAAVSEKGGPTHDLPAPYTPSNGTGISAPLYSPSHRWVYISDQKEDEAWIFKQFDTREDGRAKQTFHDAFHDPFHDNDPTKPERRSCEFRLLLTFPKKQPSARL